MGHAAGFVEPDVERTIDDFGSARLNVVVAAAMMVWRSWVPRATSLTSSCGAVRIHERSGYSGSFENRSRLALDVVQAVRKAAGPDAAVVFHLSMLKASGARYGLRRGRRVSSFVRSVKCGHFKYWNRLARSSRADDRHLCS